jgi:DNA-binding response OmpR family regulator
MTPLRVLVVDDNVDAAHALGFLVEQLGCEVSYASEGQEALRAAQVVTPDVVLLDIGLPELNGLEVARRLRGRYGKALTIIAVTGYGSADDVRKGKDAGIDHYFVKPASFAGIEPILKALARR